VKTRILRYVSIIIVTVMIGFVLMTTGCGGSKVETQPVGKEIQPPIVPREPTIDELRKPVSKDMEIYKPIGVIKHFGTLKKKSMTYEKFQKLTGGQANVMIDPDWFYDTYRYPVNENNYWITVTFGTAKRAKNADSRITQAMGDLPEESIYISLLTPSKKTYILLDSNADGILDFTKEANQPTSTKVDIKLLDEMQEKYTWILNLIRKYYKPSYK